MGVIKYHSAASWRLDLVGSCIANFLAERIKVGDGFTIGVIDKAGRQHRIYDQGILALVFTHSYDRQEL